MYVYVGRGVIWGGGPLGSVHGDGHGSMMALRLCIRLRRIDPDESGEAYPTPRTRVRLRGLRPTRGTRRSILLWRIHGRDARATVRTG